MLTYTAAWNFIRSALWKFTTRKTYKSAIFSKLDLRKLKAVFTPSGLLYTAENTLAASCFRIPEVSSIDFSRYLIQKLALDQ
jgi:hypothetical protein